MIHNYDKNAIIMFNNQIKLLHFKNNILYLKCSQELEEFKIIDTLKQAKIDSLNTKIEKCKQSIARLNDKLTNIKSNIDKKYIKPLIKIGFSESDANNMWKMADLMDEYFKYRKYINQHFFKFVKKRFKRI